MYKGREVISTTRWGLSMAYPPEWSWLRCAHCEMLHWLIVQMFRRGLLRDRAEGCSVRWRNVFRNLRWPAGIGCAIRGDYMAGNRRATR